MTRLPVTTIVGRGMLLSAYTLTFGAMIAFLIGLWLGKGIAWGRAKFWTGIATVTGIVLYTAFPPLLGWIAQEINRKIGGFREMLSIEVWREHWLETWMWRPSTFAMLMLFTFLAGLGLLLLLNNMLDRRYKRRLGTLALLTILVFAWVGFWFVLGAGARFMDIIHALGLSILVFIMLMFGETMLIMQTSMKDTRYEEYVFAARAKGLPEKTIRDKHAARIAIVPVLSRLIVTIPILLSGMVMIEYALSTGGMGRLLFESLMVQNVPVVMGSLVIIGVITLLARLFLEITIAFLDPRIRISQTSGEGSRSAAEFQSGGFFESILNSIFSGGGAKNLDYSREQVLAPILKGKSLDRIFSSRWDRIKGQARSFKRRMTENWGVFVENKLAVLGLFLIIFFTLMAFVYPFLLKTTLPKSVYDPVVGFDPLVFPNPAPPQRGHWLGTDAMGRDVLSMLLAATTPTLVVALTSALTAAAVGTLMGAVSAYFQNTPVDTVFRYLSDMLLIMPAPIVMVILGARFHEQIKPIHFGLLYGLFAGGSYVAIVMRSQALTIMAKPFISASWVAGAGARRIIFTHMVPHMLPLAAVQMMLTVIGAVIAYGFIAFVGITRAGLSWGSMIYQAFTFSIDMLGKTPWLQMLSPAIALSLFAASFYFVSRGLHEIAEPRLRKR
jgi:peptide/nickel transport system permease protein